MKLYKKIIISISLSLLCICGTITYNFNNKNNVVYADTNGTPFTLRNFTTLFLTYLSGIGIKIYNAGANFIDSFNTWIVTHVDDVSEFTYKIVDGVGFVLDTATSQKFNELANAYIAEYDLYDELSTSLVIDNQFVVNKITSSSLYSNRQYRLKSFNNSTNTINFEALGSNTGNVGISNSSQVTYIPIYVDILNNNSNNNITFRVNATSYLNTNNNYLIPKYYKAFDTLQNAQLYINSLEFRLLHGNSIYISNISQRINETNYNISQNWSTIPFNTSLSGGSGIVIEPNKYYLILNCVEVKNQIESDTTILNIGYFDNYYNVTSGIDTYYQTATWSQYDVQTSTIDNSTLDWQKYNTIIKTDTTDWTPFIQAVSAALNGNGLVDQTNGVWDVERNQEYEGSIDDSIILPYPDALDTDIDENTLNTGGSIKFGVLSLITQFLANMLTVFLNIPNYLKNIITTIKDIDYTNILEQIRDLSQSIYNALTKTYTLEDIQAIEWITALENFETTISNAITTLKSYYDNNIDFFLTGIAHPTSNPLTTMVNNVLTNSNLYWCVYAIVTYSLLRYFI